MNEIPGPSPTAEQCENWVVSAVRVVAYNAQGERHAVGQVVAYTEVPTVLIARAGAPSERVSWRADMCREDIQPGRRVEADDRPPVLAMGTVIRTDDDRVGEVGRQGTVASLTFHAHGPSLVNLDELRPFEVIALPARR